MSELLRYFFFFAAFFFAAFFLAGFLFAAFFLVVFFLATFFFAFFFAIIVSPPFGSQNPFSFFRNHYNSYNNKKHYEINIQKNKKYLHISLSSKTLIILDKIFSCQCFTHLDILFTILNVK